MKILKLELQGYKPLLFNNVNRFVYEPSSPYQIIIGTNGSGKSSVIVELTPMPGVTANYVKGGSKTITLEHRGSNYILQNKFEGASPHHSFIKDGEELNDGHTGAVQKILVEQHFNLNQSLKDLITDQVTFTGMGPQLRREWITRLSGGDLDYAIKVFNAAKVKARDLTGAIKHLKGRLVTESEKLTPKEEVEEMQRKADRLKSELTLLMESKDSGVDSEHQLMRLRDGLVEEVTTISNRILKTPVEMPFYNDIDSPESIEDVSEILNKLRTELSVSEEMLKRSQKDYDDMGDVMDALEKSGAGGIEDLKRKAEALNRDIEEVSATIQRFLVEDEPELALTATRQVHKHFESLFSTLPDNSTGHYSRERIQKAREASDKIRDKKAKANHQRDRIVDKIEHIKTAKETKCPECGYIWIPGVSENDLSRLEEQQVQLDEHLKQIAEKEKQVSEYLEAANEYMDMLRGFSRMAKDYPRLQPVWDIILEEKLHLNNPAQQTGLMDLWISDLEKSIDLARFKKKQEEYQQALNHLENIGSGGTHYAERMDKLVTDIEQYTQRCVELRKLIAQYEQYLGNTRSLKDDQALLKEKLDVLNETMEYLVAAIKNRYLNEVISDHQTSLAMLQNDIIQSDSAVKIVEDIQSQHDTLMNQADSLKILMDELSPQDGFIAEQLMGFISNMVDEINNIIGSVWTHDIEVLPCGHDSDELDYKFPLTIRGHADPAPDVSKGSTSQVEIIDFAFKMVVMLYLDMEDYPLYLDELAHSLDERHRANIMRFVHQLVETGRCSQMFLISHYQTGHGQFTTAEYCVTDPTNITVPEKYNEHVVME